jgi:hypothetical protein
MDVKRCRAGHFFDSRQHTNCPYCGVAELELFVPPGARPEPPAATVAAAASVADSTQPALTTALAIDPVVGWLVCVDGAEVGRDYRLRSTINRIGRSPEMEICVVGDQHVARGRHAAIRFDPATTTFYLLPGDEPGLLSLNGVPLRHPQVLGPFDEIRVGRTTLLFAPLCGDRFQWNS